MKEYPTIIGAKGRVTIPTELRQRLRIKPGAALEWKIDQGRLVLTPTTGIRGKAKSRR